MTIERSPPDSSKTSLQHELVEKAEKGETHFIEAATGIIRPFDKKATRRLIRKTDFYLLPFFSLLYLLSFLDRSNIGNARLDGLEKALGLKGLDYNICLAVFFPTYVLAEIPSNLMMKRFRPSIWIPSIMVFWGIICTIMGLVHNMGGLIACRLFLGLAEGGLFPGVTYYITLWYKRHECGFRMAIFFSAATAAGAFGGLLARGIAEMDGLGHKEAWAWIFIIEGLLTVVIASIAYFCMYDYPDTASFLNEDEKIEIHRRLEEDRSFLADEFDLSYFWQAVGDWKIWVHMIITIGIYTPLYSISLFLPTIVKALGYTANAAQLMTVPPYFVACFFCLLGGWLADKTKTRGVFMIFFNIVAIMGFMMLIVAKSSNVRYGGMFLVCSGIYPNVPQGVAWNGNNIGGSVKRGVGIAMHVGFGNLGGIIAAFIYQSKDGPLYLKGHKILISLISMSCTICVFMTLYLRWENRRREAIKPSHEYAENEKMAERTKGDDASFFRYTV